MGELGIDKILLILAVVLIFFGGKRIPEIAGAFGKGIREFKRNMSDLDAPPALPPGRERVASSDPTHPVDAAPSAVSEPKRLV